MEQQIFTLNEALKVFSFRDEKKHFLPFDIEFRTFNDQTKKGGKLKSFKGVKYLPEAKQELTNKAPLHFENRTRNIELTTGEIRKVKIDFIISINNKKVIY
jgi:hypothetical protein